MTTMAPVKINLEEPFEQTVVPPSENSGIVLLYDTITGVPSRCLKYLVGGTLRKRRQDGSVAFTLQPPTNLPTRALHKCMLHADAPNREAYDQMGLPACKKANLPNLFQQEQHMAHRHRVEWATIQRMEERESAEAQKAYQRTVQETLLAGRDKDVHVTCEACGEDFHASIKAAALNMLAALAGKRKDGTAVASGVQQLTGAAGVPGGTVFTADRWYIVRVEIDPNGKGRIYLGDYDGGDSLTKPLGLVYENTTALGVDDEFSAILMVENRAAANEEMEVDYFMGCSGRDWRAN